MFMVLVLTCSVPVLILFVFEFVDFYFRAVLIFALKVSISSSVWYDDRTYICIILHEYLLFVFRTMDITLSDKHLYSV